MKLNKSGKLYRWTYFLSSKEFHHGTSHFDLNLNQYIQDTPSYYSKGPDQTSLCSFFWRCFVWMPLFWLIVLTTIVMFSYAVGALTWRTRGILPLLVGIVVGTLYLIERKKKVIGYWVEDTGDRLGESVFVQGLMTIKGKFCPLIRFED